MFSNIWQAKDVQVHFSDVWQGKDLAEILPGAKCGRQEAYGIGYITID